MHWIGLQKETGGLAQQRRFNLAIQGGFKAKLIDLKPTS